MYKKVETNLNFVEREADVLAFWKENEIFKKAQEKNKGAKDKFTFYDGPPTANGKPHMGHVLTRSIKDIIPRYQAMTGKDVERKAGWDTHGLPVELEVEKMLGIDGKGEIEKFGIEPFIKHCKESVWKYKGEWEVMSDRVAFWADMEDPYITYNDKYIESVWWAFSEIAKKGLLYKGYKVVPYCPRCGTALSSHEVAQGYKDVKDTSAYVKFRAKDEENTFYLAWTTTPWTLPSNVALCMNPNENYVKISFENEFIILAEALVSALFEEGTFEIISTKKGSEYENLEYIPLFDFAEHKEKAYYIVNDTYVTLTDGSGIVHIAPAFGEDDSQIGKRYGLPFVQMVNPQGKFVEEAGEYAGMSTKDGNKLVLQDLKNRGQLFKELVYEHSYPHCWRCDSPLLYYARSSWFVKTTAVKEQLIKNNNSVNWMPKTIGEGRMGNFLENVIDWGVSRERYWGTPLPVWTCSDCDHIHVMGSKAELKELCNIDGDIELHRPYIDKPTFKCPHCGGTMKRVPEVVDCWFDSGSMPFAQYHYPFENKEHFEERFPADFISEAVDQTRGWFYTLLAISTLLFNKAPFKNCIVMGHVGDKDGIKMSKHKGNVVPPNEALDKQGADAIRWYFYSASQPWLPSRYYDEGVSEYQRKFMGTLWNTYAFYVLYANIDKFDPKDYPLDKQELNLMDKWILSKLNTLVDYVGKSLENFDITNPARKIAEFVDELSNWYIRRGRERFWGKGMDKEKTSAFATLYEVLTKLIGVIAPFTPFMAESMYQNLVREIYPNSEISVHLTHFPLADMSRVDTDLENGMDKVLDVVVLGRAARNKANIKNRQPLSKLLFGGIDFELNGELLDIIAEELNVKCAVRYQTEEDFIGFNLKPQLRTLGKIYGKNINAIREYLASCDAEAVVKHVRTGEKFKFAVSGVDVEVGEEDLLIETTNKAGYVVESDKGLNVVLDTNLSEELILEGFERELVSKIQTMRKDSGFDVVDRILVGFSGNEKIAEVFKAKSISIAKDVLADKIFEGELLHKKEWNINGEKVMLSVEVIK